MEKLKNAKPVFKQAKCDHFLITIFRFLNKTTKKDKQEIKFISLNYI